MDKIEQLRKDIAEREAELGALRAELALTRTQHVEQETEQETAAWKWPLSRDEYSRYSRQMIVPKFGVQGTYQLDIFSFHNLSMLIERFRPMQVEKCEGAACGSRRLGMSGRSISRRRWGRRTRSCRWGHR